MNDPAILLWAGLLLLAAGLAGPLAVATAGGRRRRQVTRSLESLAHYAATARPLRERQLQQPFAERVVGPLTRRFVRAGRRLTPDDRLERVRRRLDLAGNPPGWDVDRIVGLKALGLLTGAVVGLALPPLLGGGLRAIALGVIALGAAGWFGPSLWLYQVGYDRKERLQSDLPDAVDLLTISVEAGLAFDAALSQVARNTDGPLGQELFRVLQEMQIGTGRTAALRALSERTDLEDLRAFVGALVQAEGFGVPIADVLRVQSREMRVKRSQRAEEQAQKVPVKILFPLIFCIMPALFVVVLGPTAITLIDNFQGM